MQNAFRPHVLILILCFSLIALSMPAHAQTPISGGQAAGILAILIGIGVGAGVGVYYLVRTPPSITGCAESASSGLQLNNDKDHKIYSLSGDLAGIKAGDRVHLNGRRSKDAAKKEQFAVTKLSKILGPCQSLPAAP